MKKLWIALTNKLRGDTTLVSMTGYTSATNTIKRANSLENIVFSETVTRAVTFQEWTDVRTSKSSTDDMRDITMMLVCWSKTGDLEAVELKDYLISLLDGADISDANLLNYYSEYDDFSSAPYYDADEQAWRIDIRFRFKVVEK